MFSPQIYRETFVNHRYTGGFTYFVLHIVHATFCIEPRNMGAGHTVTAFYEVIPVGGKNTYAGKVDELKYQKKEKVSVKPTGSDELLTVKLRYKAPDKDVSRKIELPFVDNKGNNVSSDFRFASAVAMFGQLLRDSDFKGEATYDKVISLAKQGLDHDDK